MDIKKIIEQVGGLTKAAKIFNVPISTVQYWQRKNSVPAWRISAIQEACNKMGIDISDCYEAEEKSE